MQRLLAFTLIALFVSMVALPAAADEPEEQRLFVTITGSGAQERAMPLVLANQALDQGATVRVLLCGAGAELALTDHPEEKLAPRNVSAQDLMRRLIDHGVPIEVCAIFLPNSEYSQDDLLPKIGVAQPGEIASWMLAPNTRLFSH